MEYRSVAASSSDVTETLRCKRDTRAVDGSDTSTRSEWSVSHGGLIERVGMTIGLSHPVPRTATTRELNITKPADRALGLRSLISWWRFPLELDSARKSHGGG
ncbi:hypothetical protein F2Q69_00056133 [Brassica cretica]|uniref:Uncharacterized protein n=2 Tax=Brassica cretica TaxID=69181 RepID=A0A8S9MYX2_BRACR|nr:hypothetical protein F2Q69_00056133 [Brassica cretica]KAF3597609.1 hypothetical protein DY000_02025819 [Brassica cretica]